MMIDSNSSVIHVFIHALIAYLTWQTSHFVLQLVYIEKHTEYATLQRLRLGKEGILEDFFVSRYFKILVQLGML